MRKVYESIVMIVCLIIISGSSILIGGVLTMHYPDWIDKMLGFGYPDYEGIILNETTNISDCNLSTVFESSRCLRNKFVDIFKYNITLDYSYDNFSEVDSYIRHYGGDCHEASIWYNLSGAELGYKTKYVRFLISSEEDNDTIYNFYHAVAIIADNDGYCILDQVGIKCSMFKNGNITLSNISQFFVKSVA